MKKIVLSIILLLLLIISSILFFINTNIGSNFVINKTISLIPGLKVSYICGSLKNLKLKDIVYQLPGIKVNIDKLLLITDFNYIIDHKFIIKNLSLYNVNILIDTSKVSVILPVSLLIENFVNNYLNTSYLFILRMLNLININIKINENYIKINKFTTNILYENRILTIGFTNIVNTFISFQNLTNFIKKNIIIFDHIINLLENKGCIDFNYFIKEIKSTIINKYSFLRKINFISTNVIKSCIRLLYDLPINLIFTDLNIENFNLFNGKLLIDNLRLKLKITNQQTNLILVNLKYSKMLINICGELLIENKKYVRMLFNIKLRKFLSQRDEKIKFLIKINLYKNLNLLLKVSSVGPIVAKLLLNALFLKHNNLLLNLSYDNQFSLFPLMKIQQYQIKTIFLQYYKKLQNYQFKIRSKLIQNNLTPINLNCIVSSNKSCFNKLDLSIVRKKFLVKLNSIVNYKDNVDWKCKIYLYDRKNKIFKSKESFVVKKETNNDSIFFNSKSNKDHFLYENKFETHSNNFFKLRKIVFISSSFNLNKNLNLLNVPEIKFHVKNNYLNIYYIFNKFIKLNVNFNFIHLQNIISNLQGDLLVNTNINPKNKSVTLKLLLILKPFNLNYINAIIDRLSLRITLYRCKYNNNIFFDIKLNVTEFIYKLLHIKQLNVNLIGNKKQHYITISMKKNNKYIIVKLDGFYNSTNRIWCEFIENNNYYNSEELRNLLNSIYFCFVFKNKNIVITSYQHKNLNFKINKLQNIKIIFPENLLKLIQNLFLINIKYFFVSKNTVHNNYELINYLKYIFKNIKYSFSIFLDIENACSDNNLINKLIPVVCKQITFNIFKDKNKVILSLLFKTIKNGLIKGNIYIYNIKDTFNICSILKILNFSLLDLKYIFPQIQFINGKVNSELDLFISPRKIHTFGYLKLSRLTIKKRIIPSLIKDNQLTLFFRDNFFKLIGYIDTNIGSFNIKSNYNYDKLILNHSLKTNIFNHLLHINIVPSINLKMSFNIIINLIINVNLVKDNVGMPYIIFKLNNTLYKNILYLCKNKILSNNNLCTINKKLCDFIPINLNLIIHT